jgi:hypothetical protein
VRVAVWRSVATGAYPFRHGVVADRTLDAPFLRPTPTLALLPWGTGFATWSRPLGVRVSDRPPAPRAPALWQILEGAGLSTAVVGWPANDAVDESSRVVPESFFGAHSFGVEITASAAAERLRPSLGTVDPSVFAPLGDVVPERAKSAVVEDLWREVIARDLLARRTSDAPTAIFIGLPGLLAISRGSFGGYAAVHFDGDSRAVQRDAAQLVGGYYGFVDRLVGRLWASLPEPRLLAVVSGYGVREPEHWRRLLSTVWPERSLAGRIDGDADGIFLLLGDNLRSGERLDRTPLVDVAPTLLYAMGQPVPRDGDGKVMAAAFGSTFLTRNPLTFVPSYAALLTER